MLVSLGRVGVYSPQMEALINDEGPAYGRGSRLFDSFTYSGEVEDEDDEEAEEEARRLRKLQKRISKAIVRSSDPETRRFLKKNAKTVRRAAEEAEEAAGLRSPQFRALSRGGPAYGGGSALFDSFVPVRADGLVSLGCMCNGKP